MSRTSPRARWILLSAIAVAVIASASPRAETPLLLRARALVEDGVALGARAIERVPALTRATKAVDTASSSATSVPPPPVLVDPMGGAGAADATAAAGAAEVSACGGEGQRVCCFLENISVGLCDAGLVEIPGCIGDCKCPGIGDSLGTCVRPSACGGLGQRSCTIGDEANRRFGNGAQTCEAGLITVPGCSGNCLAYDGNNPSFPPEHAFVGVSTCMAPWTYIEEPGTNVEGSEGQTCSLKGYADMHMHMFGDQAHGGAVLAGKPYAPGIGITGALRPDFTSDLDLEWEPLLGQTEDLLPNHFDECPTWLNNLGGECHRDIFHGNHDTLNGEPIGSDQGTKDGANSNFGAPVFSGWPRWTSTTHQQVYYKWLERAWQGGLRLMVQLAVTNEAACRGSKREKGTDCFDSMASIDKQITEAYRFQSFLDSEYGGPGKGWFRIVTTPLQAREALALGKMAVVLGIETAELFNCYERLIDQPGCRNEDMKAKVHQYYELGIRHIFPVHNFDNAFGAAATWQKGIEAGQRAVEGRWWDTRECAPEGYGFKLAFDVFTQFMLSLLKFPDSLEGEYPPRPETASCNARGQTGLGWKLQQELMQLGFVIDVDHMSAKAFDSALHDAETNPRGKYPVVASHVLSQGIHQTWARHERMRTSAQLKRIRGVGGMIAAMLKDEVQDTGNKGWRSTVPYGTVTDDCRYSSKTFAQAYQYAVDQMGGINDPAASVAFGSDFNGMAGHFGPRFGSEACGGWPRDEVEQASRVPRAAQAAR